VSLTGVLNADTRGTGAVSNLWSDPANWTNGLPTPIRRPNLPMPVPPECIMDMVGAQANAGDQAGHLVVEGGVLNCQARLFIGFQGEGDLTVDKDGVVNVYNQASAIGQEKTGNGSLYVKGGTINYWAGKVIVDTTSAAGRIVVTGLYPFQPAPLDGGRVVNDADLAILQANWLKCNALDCSDVK
jgi:hypothetical protein